MDRNSIFHIRSAFLLRKMGSNSNLINELYPYLHPDNKKKKGPHSGWVLIRSLWTRTLTGPVVNSLHVPRNLTLLKCEWDTVAAFDTVDRILDNVAWALSMSSFRFVRLLFPFVFRMN